MYCANCGSPLTRAQERCPACRRPVTPPAGDAPHGADEPEDTVLTGGAADGVTVNNPRAPRGGAPPAGEEPHARLIGRVLAGRYRLVSVIGRGGMSTVYKAEHLKIDRPTAIKVLNADLARNPEFVARFHLEAKTASNIDHPNAVTVYDAGDEDDILFIAMEYLDGQPLSALLKGGPLPVGRAVGIARQAAAALAAAHRLGFVHRDFKPDNVMVCQRPGQPETVKVVDFGIAKRIRVDPQYSSLTRTGYLVGTPQYVSPEQVIDEHPDPRSDLYSLALVTYEMMTGGLPFTGPSVQKVMINRLVEPPRPMRAVRPDIMIAPAVEAVIMKALAREREGRHSSTMEFADALEAAYAGSSVPAPPPRPEPHPAAVTRGGPSLWAVAAVVLALIGVGFGAVAVYFSTRPRATTNSNSGAPASHLVDNTAATTPPASTTPTPLPPAAVAASLLSAVEAGRLVTLTNDDAYSHFMKLRGQDPRHEALRQVEDDVLPRLVSMGDEVMRRKEGVAAEGLTARDWQRTARALEWACLLSSGDKKLEARRKFAEAELAKRQDNREEAERKFYAATQLDGSWALPQNSLGLLSADREKFADAETYYRQAIRLRPDWAIPYNNLGTVYLNLKNYRAAEAWYRAALQRNSSWARPHLGLGAIYESEGDVAGALAEYKTALGLDPSGVSIDAAKLLSKIRQMENR